MSLMKLFSDELSILNDRESLYKLHLPRTAPQSRFVAPPHNLDTDNLLVFVNGNLKIRDLDFQDVASDAILFFHPIDPADTVLILLIRTGADYSSNNTAIAQWYHGMTDPAIGSGKNDDYFLNIESGDLFSKTNGDWIKIFTFGEGGGGCSCDGSFSTFGKLIFQSLAFERTRPLWEIETGIQNPDGKTFLLYLNGFLLDFDRDYYTVGSSVIFREGVAVDKDVVLYQMASDDKSGNFSLVSKSLSGERSKRITTMEFTRLKKSEFELIFLNGFLLLPRRDYELVKGHIVFNFSVKREWDLHLYKAGVGDIFGFCDRVLISEKGSRGEDIETISLQNIDDRDRIMCFLNGFLLSPTRDYHFDGEVLEFEQVVGDDKDLLVLRWANRSKPETFRLEWSSFSF